MSLIDDSDFPTSNAGGHEDRGQRARGTLYYGLISHPEKLVLEGQEEVFLELKEYIKENKFCIDCGSTQTTWGAVNMGLFLCLNCAGTHRSLGTHISFVRSIDLDKWNIRQLLFMILGGNYRFQMYAAQYIPHLVDAIADVKYKAKQVEEYRVLLKKEVDRIYKELDHSGKIPKEQKSSSSNSMCTSPTSSSSPAPLSRSSSSLTSPLSRSCHSPPSRTRALMIYFLPRKNATSRDKTPYPFTCSTPSLSTYIVGNSMTSSNSSLKGFETATSISSADLFPEQEPRRKKRSCCCFC